MVRGGGATSLLVRRDMAVGGGEIGFWVEIRCMRVGETI